MIRFTKPDITALEKEYVLKALEGNILSGDGAFTKRVYEQFRQRFGIEDMLLTTSGTTALEMAALLLSIEPGDEVILPSFTFSSTANAVVLRGAKPVFCDINPATMNMDAARVKELITPKTKSIYVVHYAGVVCEMDEINAAASANNILVVEDAAQAVGSYYKGRAAGTISTLGCYSFHGTKNYIMGEGGALVINDEQYLERAEIIREKGTDRTKLLKGLVDKYTWQDIGSSYLPSDILAALLAAQMERFDEIMASRMKAWEIYHESFADLADAGKLQRPFVPEHVDHNAHMYYLVLPTRELRDRLIDDLRQQGVQGVFHYIPLHSSPMGQRYGYTAKDLPLTEEYAGRLIRLPLYSGITEQEAMQAADTVRRIVLSY